MAERYEYEKYTLKELKEMWAKSKYLSNKFYNIQEELEWRAKQQPKPKFRK